MLPMRRKYCQITSRGSLNQKCAHMHPVYKDLKLLNQYRESSLQINWKTQLRCHRNMSEDAAGLGWMGSGHLEGFDAPFAMSNNLIWRIYWFKLLEFFSVFLLTKYSNIQGHSDRREVNGYHQKDINNKCWWGGRKRGPPPTLLVGM